MKWLFYVVVFVYMFYRAVYGEKKVYHTNILTIQPVNYDANKDFHLPGDPITIKCIAVANKGQRVQWIDPSGKNVTRTKNRISLRYSEELSRWGKVQAASLVITSATVEDSGVWTCVAGDEKKNTAICVIDPAEFVETTTEVNADSGRSITLSCQVRGDPEPRLIKWSRSGKEITDDFNSSKYRTMIKYNREGIEGLLTIMSLNPEDTGNYTCEAVQQTTSDCSHEESLNIFLQVNYALTFLGGERSIVYASEGDSVELVCAANGYPTPKYRFFKVIESGEKEEIPQNEIQFIDDEKVAMLILTESAPKSIFGLKYECWATNRYGNFEKSFLIQEYKRPTKPHEDSSLVTYSYLYQPACVDEPVSNKETQKLEIETQKIFHNKITLAVTWNAIDFPVTSFDIQYLKSQKAYPTERDWRRSQTTTELSRDDIGFEITNADVNDYNVTLRNLEEDTAYWIRLRAVNNVGKSPWSRVIKATTTKAEEDVEPEEVEVENEEASGEEENKDNTQEEEMSKSDTDSSKSYGILFAGGIIITAIAFMFAMRMV